MASFGGAVGAASFNELQSTDTTSAPSMQAPQQPQAQQPPQGLAQALARRKKKGIGATVKTPSTLAAAISRAKRARPSSEKYG
jgi:hypothetical protein